MDGDPVVYQLIYTSIATPALDDFALREIAQSSCFNNQLLGLTGLLLFDSRSILQVIEGDEMSVYSLYGKIKRDKRHIHCKILNAGMGQNREFLDAFMGYKNITGHPGADSLFNLNQNKFGKALPVSPPHELEALAPSFQKAG